MPCTTQLSLNQAASDNAMQAATYDPTDSVIIGIRGNRLFVCDATSGSILSQLDVGPLALCGTVIWCNGIVYAATYMLPQYALAGSVQQSKRFMYRLHVSGTSLVLDQTIDVATMVGAAVDNVTYNEVGIVAFDTDGTRVYARYKTDHLVGQGSGGSMQFVANPFGSVVNANEGTDGGWNNIVFGTIGGHPNAIFADPQGGPQVQLFDYTSMVQNPFNVTAATMMVAVGYAPTQSHIFVSEGGTGTGLIDVYNTGGGASIAQINTGHPNLAGLAIRYRSTDGLIYVAGGVDNSVAVINPATNTLSGAILTGFDAPVDFVFTPSKRFAVQAGSTPLKAF